MSDPTESERRILAVLAERGPMSAPALSRVIHGHPGAGHIVARGAQRLLAAGLVERAGPWAWALTDAGREVVA